MKLILSKKKPVIGIVGHVGCGHAHSHNGFIQDDSGGLAVTLALLNEATQLDLSIRSVEVKGGVDAEVVVTTNSGGVGKARAKRGISTFEAKLMKSVEGKDSTRTQAICLEAFGRIYGQGGHEAAVALQSAVANAALDSFIKCFPDEFYYDVEDIKGNYGLIISTVIEIVQKDKVGIPVAIMALVNATEGGVGPVEDYEGNICIGAKKRVMDRVGLNDLPTIILEGKVYTPSFSDDATNNYFLIRADDNDDNPFVAQALESACTTLGYKHKYRKDVMARSKMALENLTRALSDKLVAEATKLQDARFAQEKVEILANIVRLASEDGGGISFMSDRLHEVVGGVGMMPGTAAVLSLIVSKEYRQKYVFPYFTEQDIMHMSNIAKYGAIELTSLVDEATKHLKNNKYNGDLENLVLKK